MNTEELTRYKNMSVEDIDRKFVPDIEDIKNNISKKESNAAWLKIW